MALVTLPRQYLADIDGAPRVGARLYVYNAGTNDTRIAYTTKAYAIEHTQPIESVEGGIFPAIYVNPTGGDYKLVIQDADGAPLYTEDNIPAQVFDSSDISDTLNSLKRTPQEIAAGVILADSAYLPGWRPRYASLADAVAVSASHPLMLFSDETITTHITLPDKAKIYGIGRPQILNSTPGDHVFDADNKSQITIEGVRFRGANSSTTPVSGIGPFSPSNNGLITISRSSDIRIKDCEADRFFNGITVQGCTRAWVTDNYVSHFTFVGIIGSSSSDFHIDDNDVVTCDQAGAAVAYGITASGDEQGVGVAGAVIQKRSTIKGNRISGIPSWDGIMTHDCDGLDITGNDIRDVRQAIDVGHLNTDNRIRNVNIANNYCESTATNTWGVTGAQHAGIAVAGAGPTQRLLGVTITGNTVNGFFATSGMVGAGTPSHIIVSNADDVTVTGNIVKNGGSVISNAGIYMTGTVNRIAITGNTLQGTMAKGAIRGEGVTSDLMSIAGNIAKQGTASDNAILFSGSTVTALAIGQNTSNSTAHFAQGTSTLTFAGEELEGSATYDPPSLVDAAGTTTTVTVTGAAVGDFAVASFGGDISGVSLTAYVSAADTVSVRFQNESGGTVDLGSSTLRARVLKRH